MPVQAPAGRNIPAAVLGTHYNERYEPRAPFSGLISGGSQHYGDLKYGAGYFEIVGGLSGENTVALNSVSAYVRFEQKIKVGDLTTRSVGGDLTSAEDLNWDSLEVIVVTRSIKVPTGSELRIAPGVLVLVNTGANIEIDGRLLIAGGVRLPVVFMCSDPAGFWGGIYLDGGIAEIDNCLLTDGGGDDSRAFGHSNSQPVIGGRNSEIYARGMAVVDNRGKAFGFERSEISLSECLIQRCDTGGEFAACKVVVDDCWFLDMPSDDDIPADDDNDGIYLNGVRNADTSFIRDSYFVTGKDDAIDHNGALAVINNCIIEDFDNEGVAASSSQYVRIENCFITNCEQGVEAGYGAPFVEINHCTIYRCETGIRFGDWYNWGCYGHIVVTNSLSIENSLFNVRNFDVLTNSPVAGAIGITFSIVNDSTFDSGKGCLVGTPRIDEFGVLLATPHQPGRRAGNDSTDMGRLEKWQVE